MELIKTKLEELTAEVDLTVYKTVIVKRDGIYSLYLNFIYELNKIYKLRKPLEIEKGLNEINKGFHSYMLWEDADVMRQLYKLDKIRVAACIIPAGSKYYMNKEDGELVSDAIKIVEVEPLRPKYEF